MIKTIDELLPIIHNLQSQNKKIVFTNGVFDILHKGHVDYLNDSAALGDFLVVGINSDASVRRLKGPTRPVNNEIDRAYIIKNLKSVWETFIFDEDTPFEAIKKIIPDVLVKGGDYSAEETDTSSPKYIVGSDIVKHNGGVIITINLTDGKSTTGIINKISKQE